MGKANAARMSINKELESEKTNEDNIKDQIPLGKDMEFHSQFGKVLYQTLKQYQNDVESFKKTATFILRDYNANKAKLYK